MYLKLGFAHVLDWKGYDHMLFLIVLCVAFLLKDWKKALLYVTVFTVGHTFSMCLSVFDILKIDERAASLFIPLTILVTAVYRIFFPGVGRHNAKHNFLLLSCFVFGCIHGLGFSLYFSVISDSLDSLLVPLFAFMVGIELSQLVLVFGFLILNTLLHLFFHVNQRDRILVIAAMVVGLTLPMLSLIHI